MNPFFGSETAPRADHLRAGEFPAATEDVTILSGQNLPAGAVLGQISHGSASAAAKAGGNTGAGVLTLDATTPVRPGAKVGIYTVRCVATAAAGGMFRVEDPDGFVLGDVAVGATFDDDIKFSIADGDPDFALGDGFDITIAAGSGKYKLAVAAAVDGSAVAKRILAVAVDATSADKNAPVYMTGEFRKNMLTFGSGHTAATVRTALEAHNIYIRESVGA